MKKKAIKVSEIGLKDILKIKKILKKEDKHLYKVFCFIEDDRVNLLQKFKDKCFKLRNMRESIRGLQSSRTKYESGYLLIKLAEELKGTNDSSYIKSIRNKLRKLGVPDDEIDIVKEHSFVREDD